MAGISDVLNIAKQALLAHQMSIQVAGHNVSNVDTPGYTRQTLLLNPALPNPSGVGPIGNGVEAVRILRQYDNFATQRIMQAESNIKNLDAQNQAMRMVEAAFNEAPGLALNDLLSKFWDAWQEVADNPESLPSRQSLVQQAELFATQLQSMHNEIVRTRNDIGTNLESAIDEANSLIDQLAQLNGEIAATETPTKKANDMRDQRDVVLKELSGLLDINYFETADGNYTVMLADGHTLVENDQSWNVGWEDDALIWIGERRNQLGEFVEVKTTIGKGAELGGKIGGWLEIYNRLDATDPSSYAGRLDAFTRSFIREVNQQHSQGVGMTSFADVLRGTGTAKDTAVLTGTIDTTTASTDIPDGTLKINGRSVGRIDGSVVTNGVAAGKAYNAVQAINAAVTGVTARLTTQVAGSAVTAATAAEVGSTISFSIEDQTVTYTIQAGDTDAATFAANLASAINSAMSAADITVRAKVGDGSNGGEENALILYNTNTGDESSIQIADLDLADIDAKTGLANDIYEADASHNSGQVSLFSADPFTVEAGATDSWLAHFGWDGGTVSADDDANDGRFKYTYTDGGVANSLLGFEFGADLTTDGAAFEIWLYNSDGTLAAPQPVSVSLERVFTLDDVVQRINDAVATAATGSSSWLRATNDNGQLELRTDGDHRFAFANDTGNILQVAGLNTLFSGDQASNIAINSVVADDVTMLAAATVSSRGDIFRGDNSNALAITNLQRAETIAFRGHADDSFDSFYNSLVGSIGIDGQQIKNGQQFHDLLANQLNEMRDSTSGVSLDEEMANLMKYQHAYTAAARLITMSDELLRTLLQSV